MNLTPNEWITAAIATYAALVSTFTLIVQQLEKRKKIRTELSLGFIAPGRSQPIDVITIEATNFGNVPVHLSSCLIRLPNTKEKVVAVFEYNKDFPITLNPGENIQAWLSSEKFIEIAKKSKIPNDVVLVGEFSNKSLKGFRSKPYPAKLDEMLFAKQQASKSAA
jgi:hypothetical protein